MNDKLFHHVSFAKSITIYTNIFAMQGAHVTRVKLLEILIIRHSHIVVYMTNDCKNNWKYVKTYSNNLAVMNMNQEEDDDLILIDIQTPMNCNQANGNYLAIDSISMLAQSYSAMNWHIYQLTEVLKCFC